MPLIQFFHSTISFLLEQRLSLYPVVTASIETLRSEHTHRCAEDHIPFLVVECNPGTGQ